jgi:citrate lyase subunit beta/citryl-CoA lyase
MAVNSKVSRSWLLVNASREPDLDGVLAQTKADEVILDLEDAVAPNEKEAARDRVVDFLNSGARAWVRINDASSDFWSADCRALADCPGMKGVVLAKTEGGNHMWDTANRLGGKVPVIALIETARGLSRAQDIAAALADGVALTRRMGMTGKLALRSSDAETINIGLSPSDSDITWAQEFVEQFNSRGGKPKDGSDLPRLNRARIILKKARQLRLISHR